MEDYKNSSIKSIREKVGDGKVLLALSGGVDSSVAAALLAEAVGNQLTCVFVDHGLMRKDEGDEVEAAFAKWDINFIRVDAEKRFWTSWPVFPIRKQSARSSVRNLSAFSRRKAKKSARSIIWSRNDLPRRD